MKLNDKAVISTKKLFDVGTTILQSLFTKDALEDLGTEGVCIVADGIAMTIAALYGDAIGMASSTFTEADGDALMDVVKEELLRRLEERIGHKP